MENVSLELCPKDLLECTILEELSKWLPLFAVESRNSNGGHYTPATISHLLSGILRHISEINPDQHVQIFLIKLREPSFKAHPQQLRQLLSPTEEHGYGYLTC